MSGAHVPVMLREAVAALNVREDGAYIDATFGRGGHSRAILDQLGESGRLLAIDRDPEAVAVGMGWRNPRFRIVHATFGSIGQVARENGMTAVDGVLFDLGLSSPQIEVSGRGFSFRRDDPLDMRMDPSQGMSAAEWLNTADVDEIARVVRGYGEERFAKSVARAIVAARQMQPIATSGQLARIVAGAVRSRERGQDPAARTFQAVRIHINRELEELEQALPTSVELLKVGGRLVVISFHSLEDRRVKQFIRAESRGEVPPPGIPIRGGSGIGGRLRPIGRAQRPSTTEVLANPRARSAVLRVAERRGAPCHG